MRDLDQKSLLVNDFLIVYGDLVSNIPLEAALAAHRARRATDKNAIMTMVLREAGPAHRTMAQGTSPVFVIDPARDRCLHFEQMPARRRPAGEADAEGSESKSVNIDRFKIRGLEVRRDLIDCGIDICTPDALALWSDNFDYEAPRRGYLHAVLKDYELNGKTIHTYILEDQYAARVRNLHAYDSVSRDILARWAYPLCPDSNLVRGQSYRLQRGNIYKEDGVILARTCEIYKNTVIGKGTTMGDKTAVANSIIGRGCNIGKNVKIEGAYIWDNTIIGDGAVIKRAIVANGAMIGKRCRVEPGALISYGVTIADDTVVKGTSRITKVKVRRKQADSSLEDNLEKGESDPAVVGEKGDGFEFADEDEERDPYDALAFEELLGTIDDADESDDSISAVDSEDEDMWSDEGAQDHPRRPAADSFASNLSLDSEHGQQSSDFYHDASLSIFDSLQRGDETTNIQLELTALRMSANASEHQVRRAVVTAFMKRIAQVLETDNNVKTVVPEIFGQHVSLVQRTMFDKGQDQRGDQVDFLLLMQQDLVHRNMGDLILLNACTTLFKLDLIEEEGFLQWWEDPKSKDGGEEMTKVRAKAAQFIEFLQQEDESSEEDDEESDEE